MQMLKWHTSTVCANAQLAYLYRHMQMLIWHTSTVDANAQLAYLNRLC
jgi:hypothetical protein